MSVGRVGRLTAAFLLLVNLSSLSLAAEIPGLSGSSGLSRSVSSTALPVLLDGGTVSGVAGMTRTSNSLDIQQNSSSAVIDWSSFDIGEKASVTFDQQGNSSWSVLNRIYDSKPSQILGKLTADGKVYLVNRNGILFGADSQVNVHSLVASSLNITEENFKNGLLTFEKDVDSPGAVENEGVIATKTGGSVYLIAPSVSNSGKITAYAGQVGLVGASSVTITTDANASSTRSALVVNIADEASAGEATNQKSGSIITDSGLAGLYGKNVTQNGLIRATSTAQQKGMIELQASGTVATGEGSVTECPVDDSTEEYDQSYDVDPDSTSSGVHLEGLTGISDGLANAIYHYGSIYAPSGLVELLAVSRVYLADSSSIDVSGLWVEKSAESRLVEATLNSVELRDDYDQKEGVLQGETVLVDKVSGSSIGDVSGYITSVKKTTREMASNGGSVTISASDGDVIVKSGAYIGFAGGGTLYEDGFADSTMLIAGNKVYNISDAPEGLTYDSIIDGNHASYTESYERFGVEKEYYGLYYGGANAIRNYSGGCTEGADAGTLSLSASVVVIDGVLNGSVVQGYYQTEDDPDESDDNDVTTAMGLKTPTAGSLILGTEDVPLNDVILSGSGTVLAGDFGAEDVLSLPSTYTDSTGASLTTSVISTNTLNNAGLGSLYIVSSTRVKTEEDADLTLAAGGTLEVRARRIEHEGGITVPSGTVNLYLVQNRTSSTWTGADIDYVDLQERIYLGSGSVISVAGETVDRTLVSSEREKVVSNSSVNGGSIILKDQNPGGGSASTAEGVFVASGAVLDVSGGYVIDKDGSISGGDAGDVTMQGKTVALDGDLRGYSLSGNDGGTITVYAKSVTVTSSGRTLPSGFGADSVLPSDYATGLVIAGSQFDATGFSNVNLYSHDDLTVEEGVSLSTSRAKLATPTPGGGVVKNLNGAVESAYSGNVVKVNDEAAGSSGLGLYAGVTFLDADEDVSNSDAALTIASGARLTAGLGGSITMAAPSVTVSGALTALGGDVTVTAKNNDLVLTGESSIDVSGYAKLSDASTVKGLATEYEAVDAGDIVLEATAGSLSIMSGAALDASGSSSVEKYVLNDDGTIGSEETAGAAGSITLGYYKSLDLAGELTAKARLDGISGGDLTLVNYDPTGELALSSSRINGFLGGGFDNLTFESYNRLTFTDDVSASVGEKLTLDAAVIDVAGHTVNLESPWIVMQYSLSGSSSYEAPADRDVEEGDGALMLSAGYLEISGGVALSGAQSVTLKASRDVMLSDLAYTDGYVGELNVSAANVKSLVLQADRIYPTTASDFTIASSGSVYILSNGNASVSGDIYSAGGSITITAENIEQAGYLAAPLGSITLDATGRLYLASGSVTSTKGTVAVNYGEIDENTLVWKTLDKSKASDSYLDVEDVPEKSITLEGAEVVTREGATVDVSGGGSIYAYLFQSGTEGTSDPLSVSNRYVIVPSGSVSIPGTSVYLSGVDGLAEGEYTLLSKEYAFLPGAIVVTDLGETSGKRGYALSDEGWTLTTGYYTSGLSGYKESSTHLFSVASASDVLARGNFEFDSMTAGDAGELTIAGNTTILDGSFLGSALSGYSGGVVTFVGDDVVIGDSSTTLSDSFGFEDAIPDAYSGKLYFSSALFTDGGYRKITVGDDGTLTITMEPGGSVEAGEVTLSALNAITLQEGASVYGSGEEGVVNLESLTGTVSILSGAVVHAATEVNIYANAIDYSGEIKIDNGALNLIGNKVYVAPSGYSGDASDGLYITDALWSKFSHISNIGLVSYSDLVFLGDVTLSAGSELTIDALRLLGTNDANVTLASETVNIKNTSSASTLDSDQGSGSLTVTASNVNLGTGDIFIDGFGAVNIYSAGDLSVIGSGSLTAESNLTLSAARITASLYASEPDEDDNVTYEAADFKILAGAHNASTGTYDVVIQGSGGSAGGAVTLGGSLEVLGNTIAMSDSALIEVQSGKVQLSASNGIHLESGTILGQGSAYSGGSSIIVDAGSGNLVMDSGFTINVDAGAQGDAGSVAILASSGSVALNGALSGKKYDSTGNGGSFSLDVDTLDSFSTINSRLASGGFDYMIDVLAHSGDITVGSSDVVTARQVKLTAETGSITVAGVIDADIASDGGSVGLYAENDVSLQSGSKVYARGADDGADGGSVLINAQTGYIDFENGALIDGSGNGGDGGTVHFRALRTSDGSGGRFSLNGEIRGNEDATVIAEAFKVYSASKVTSAASWNSDINTWVATLSNAGSPASFFSGLTLTGLDASQAHLRPGVEVASSGDLTVSSAIDLTDYRYDVLGSSEPGILTLRAADDLAISKNLVDHPSSYSGESRLSGVQESTWAFNLIAGGDLTLASGVVVYTDDAPIYFKTGGDATIGVVSATNTAYNYMVSNSVPYSIGTFYGSITGDVGGDLVLNGGVIQTAVGDIDLDVGGDVELNKSGNFRGAIRTTGRAPDGSTQATVRYYWNYADGGDVFMNVGGSVLGGVNADAWDYSTSSYYYANYGQGGSKDVAQGIVTMAGGNVTVKTGGDFVAQAGTFGEGNLEILSGGDVDGLFLVRNGTGLISSLGSFGQTIGTATASADAPIEMFDAQVTLFAQGNIELGTVLNPYLALEDTLLYSEDGSVTLMALLGDVSLAGTQSYLTETSYKGYAVRLLPPTVSITAGDDILFGNSFALAPSETGQLSLVAGGDIDGEYEDSSGNSVNATLYFLDLDPSDVYGVKLTSSDVYDLFKDTAASSSMIHADDDNPIVIAAGEDVGHLNLRFSKSAEITAGRDIYQISYIGQNLNSDDVTSLIAGRDITDLITVDMATLSDDATEEEISDAYDTYNRARLATGIQVGGPGYLVVAAANSIDLGSSLGIRTIGNQNLDALGNVGSSLVVMAGYNMDKTPEEIVGFFDALREVGVEYSELQADGDASGALALVEEARQSLVYPFLGDATGEGNVDMIKSEITTILGGDISIIAANDVNVGYTTLATSSGNDEAGTGINTRYGGAINIFAENDVNVNESRVMTWFGGDITAWSDVGDINAGRGSKTAVNMSKPHKEAIPDTNPVQYKYVITPVAAGSGMRTLTYDPDGASGEENAPTAGDIYLFAPSGVIDAGEAGISGNKIILGATEVLNAQNINFSVASVGVPTTSDTSVGIGSVTGVSNLVEQNKMIDQASGMASAREQLEKDSGLVDKVISWLDVKVTGFYMDAGAADSGSEDDSKKEQ